MNYLGKFSISKLNFIFVLLYLIAFVNMQYISFYIFFKYIAVLVIGTFLFKNYKLILNRKYIKINLAFVLLSALAILSAYVNKDSIESRNIVLSAIIFFMIRMETLLCIELANEKNKGDYLVQLYYKLTVLFVFLTDFLMFLVPALANTSEYPVYLVGTKFDVSYLHMQLIVLYLLTNKFGNKRITVVQKAKLALYIIISLTAIYTVECNTGLIGFVLLLILLFLNNTFYKVCANPAVYIGTLLISCSFLFFYEIILTLPLIQNLIINVFQRNLTLTGRTAIYLMLPYIILPKLWLGYGFGSNYEISIKYLGYADTQNALAEWILQIGLIGTIALIFFLYLVIGKLHKNRSALKNAFPAMAYLYVLALLGAVEITLGDSFFFWILFLLIFACRKKESN